MQYSKEFLLEIHRNLLETRLLEEKMKDLYAQGRVPGRSGAERVPATAAPDPGAGREGSQVTYGLSGRAVRAFGKNHPGI